MDEACRDAVASPVAPGAKTTLATLSYQQSEVYLQNYTPVAQRAFRGSHRMKVLLSAYACLPNRGTEPGNGWGLAVHLARVGTEVHVLTALGNREQIQAHIRDYPVPGVSFHYVDYPTKRFRSEEMRYFLWQ